MYARGRKEQEKEEEEARKKEINTKRINIHHIPTATEIGVLPHEYE
jgi:hypothetical protein